MVAMCPELEDEVLALYTIHADHLLRYATSLLRSPDEAADAVQEVFLRYFMERSYGREIDNPRAWLFRVTHNYALDRLSSAAMRNEVRGHDVDGIPGWNHSPETLVLQAQAARQMASALTARELECVTLRAQGFSYQEMADTLRLSLGTIGALLNRVHQKLRRSGNRPHARQTESALALPSSVR
ncbi:MAG: hypothetical protein C5B51_19380 [Terriglobia bacterium]|nr:MAG: hypothetical protein C5B51_19380 [Terriglobia bacterium]